MGRARSARFARNTSATRRSITSGGTATATLEIEQIYTSFNNPKGNADTERMMRTIKEELIWLNDFTSFEQAKNALKHWIENDYNKLYVHSALGYVSPEEFEKQFHEKLVAKAA